MNIEDFQAGARAWLAGNMPRRADRDPTLDLPENDDRAWARTRELQKRLWAGGFAGIAFPREYGGLGLTPAHQRAFNDEAQHYEMPLKANIPTFAVCAATLLDVGTEQQKRDRIGAVLRGDELMAQFLSEPRGGSDLAGVTTRADRDGDEWVLNGAKVWSTGAYAADWALCLARTDWTVPKHRGLTMFLVKVHQPGVVIRRIVQVSGFNEFCEEFFDNVRLPADAVVGEVGGGWAVASRQLFHERNSMGGGSPYVSGKGLGTPAPTTWTMTELARAVGRQDDPVAWELIGEARANELVREHLTRRVTLGIASGGLPGPATSMTRLFHAETTVREFDLRLELAGSAAVTDNPRPDGAGRIGHGFLSRQTAELGGGSTEMARNVISERLLGMPREHAADRDVPFNQVKQGRV